MSYLTVFILSGIDYNPKRNKKNAARANRNIPPSSNMLLFHRSNQKVRGFILYV